MEDEPIGRWLEELASAAPAPGGGGVAALEVALGAALLEMACNLTIGRPAYAEHEATMLAARAAARTLRTDAMALVEEDATAFRAVIDAYKLPRGDEAEATRRSERIELALAGAADVPRRTALAAAEILTLAESIVPRANPNVVSDVAAAAAAAGAALSTALVNIEVNRGSIGDAELKASLGEAIAEAERQCARAEAVVTAVRMRTAG